jgi:hypothetical protein
MPQLTAKNVLDMRFISYAAPLELARRWSLSEESSHRSEARVLLEGLFHRFPRSLEIAQQLALAYLEEDRQESAQLILDQIALLCRNPHEEVLSRGGRLYRDHGDRYVKYPEIGGHMESPPNAVHYYRLALNEYNKAYQIRFGHYPGINVATLHLLIAALVADEAQRNAHLRHSWSIVQKLLERRATWPHERKDDPIWHWATEGEARLLLKEWDDAAACYRAARQHPQFQAFHGNSMRKQAIRIIYCYRRLGKMNLGPFEDFDEMFPAVVGKPTGSHQEANLDPLDQRNVASDTGALQP